MMNSKFSLLAIALWLSPLTTACVHQPAPSQLVEVQRSSTLTDASVTYDEETGAYLINWDIQGARSVRVFASTRNGSLDLTNTIAAGRLNAPIVVRGLGRDQHWFFTLMPDRGAALTITERSPQISTAPNLRDAGGYRTSDGHWVRMGALYRSDQLDRLSDADLARLAALDIGAVADLRTSSERQREPDRIPSGSEHIILDVAADASGSLGGDMRQAMGMIASGKGAEMLTAANRDFVNLPAARAAYGALIRRIANDDKPVLYHCTAGKDRTGWASAIILTLLGVPREIVLQDYLASNAYLAEKNKATLLKLKDSGAALNPEALEPVLGVRASYIAAAFDEVAMRYGSMEAYARNGLGIDGATLNRLRSRLIVGEAQH